MIPLKFAGLMVCYIVKCPHKGVLFFTPTVVQEGVFRFRFRSPV